MRSLSIFIFTMLIAVNAIEVRAGPYIHPWIGDVVVEAKKKTIASTSRRGRASDADTKARNVSMYTTMKNAKMPEKDKKIFDGTGELSQLRHLLIQHSAFLTLFLTGEPKKERRAWFLGTYDNGIWNE
jgi:hypothetical protein